MVLSDYTAPFTERLDQIATRLYGSPGGYVETILDANPGLAGEGLLVAAGRGLRVPAEDSAAATTEVVRLWT